MRIGALSKATGVSVRMLRYYEARGVLTAARTASGYRDYDAQAAATVRRVRQLSDVGLTLDKIVQLLPCLSGDELTFYPCEMLRAALQREIAALDDKMQALADSRRLLVGFLAQTAPESAD